MTTQSEQKLDIDITKKQAEAIKNKAKFWLSYINGLSDELNTQKNFNFYLFREASLWATTFLCIEWLLLFGLYETGKDHLKTGEVAVQLKKYWGWDEELGKLFWKSGRNPIMHVGQVNSFYSYYSFNNLPTNVSLNSSNNWTEAVTGEWSKYHNYKAVAILPPLKTDRATIQIVAFFHQILKDELLPTLSSKITEEILKETDKTKLTKLYKLNIQIPH